MVSEPAPDPVNNGFLEANMTFEDNSNQWLGGVPDFDGGSPFNWIRCGTNTAVAPVDIGGDEQQIYEGVTGGTWAPLRMTTSDPGGPKPPGMANFESFIKLSNLASVDPVITDDKSKWSRALVIETADGGIGIGNAAKGNPTKSLSVVKNGLANFPSPNGDNNDFDSSMSWFPGESAGLVGGPRVGKDFGCVGRKVLVT